MNDKPTPEEFFGQIEKDAKLFSTIVMVVLAGLVTLFVLIIIALVKWILV